jgi:hypothetical protein
MIYQASQMKNCGTCGTHDTDFVAQGNISVIQIKSQNLGCMAEMDSSLVKGALQLIHICSERWHIWLSSTCAVDPVALEGTCIIHPTRLLVIRAVESH